MDALNIFLDGKKFEFLNNKNIDGKDYIAFFDEKSIYIKEYKLDNNKLEIIDLDDETFVKVKEVFGL